METNLMITSIRELEEISKGAVIELPAFSPEHRFIARVKRPSLLKLMAEGAIPNSLKTKANELFAGRATFSVDDDKALSELYDLLKIFAGACLVEPSIEDLERVGISLTDEQLMFLFNYAQKGMKTLGDFRKKETNTKHNKYGKNVSYISKQNSENR